jgi:CrcB protein
LKQILLIFLGGGLGSIFRYLISNISLLYFTKIPYHTLISNSIGCLIFGLVMGWAFKNNQMNSPQIMLIATGFCGGLTTFSTFAYENIEFIKSGDLYSFVFYTFISIVISFSSILIGIQLLK